MLAGKKAVMIIASQKFRDEELAMPKGVLERNGVKVTVACSSLAPSQGMLGMKITPDILIDKIKLDDYNAIIFVGGSGSSQYWNNHLAHSLAKEAVQKNKVLGAICIAPVILANAGVLKGKKATASSSVVGDIKAQGADYVGPGVVVDGKIITADGPASAEKFGKAIVEALSK